MGSSRVSILFTHGGGAAEVADRPVPPFFHDLNLDQVVDAVTSGRTGYNLAPLFCTPVPDLDTIAYRHEVWRDLENAALVDHLRSFARKLRIMRDQLTQAEKLHYRYQRERWHVDAVETYCDAVTGLVGGLHSVTLTARGLVAYRDYLTSYAGSEGFTSLVAETAAIKEDLGKVRYCLIIKDNRITVRKYDGEADYSEQVAETFEKFRQGEVTDYRAGFRAPPEMNHVEAGVLDRVALLFPDTFAALNVYCERHADHVDDTVANFDREVQFYLAYLEYIEALRTAGLEFCYPEVSDRDKEVFAYETFDLALAHKLAATGTTVVRNDFSLRGPERILVVSGPNQGGKTTLARTFGQLHYLASIGCLVPGADARLFLPDQVFTHFEREEDLRNLSGKLEDELARVHDMLARATSASVIILNEIFSATTLSDALYLGTEVLERVIALDALCVCVTFIDELASLSDSTVSMVAGVEPDDPAIRTYKLVRKPADGRAYAVAIAEKYGLTYQRLKERVAS